MTQQRLKSPKRRWSSFNSFRNNLKHSCWILAIVAAWMLQTAPAFAEGSVDFINYPGYRLFLDAASRPQHKVFVRSGEFINVGASHLGFNNFGLNIGGLIRVYRPNGTVHSVFSAGAFGSVTAIINNSTQEQNGPTGGGTTLGAGYVPGVVQAGASEEGIWTVTFDYPSYSGALGFANLLNNQPWNKNANQPATNRVVLAWDVTVSQGAAGNRGGTPLKGRLFTNEQISIVNEAGVTTQFSTSPKYYVLSKDGFLYKVDFADVKPWGFPISSNTVGLTFGNQQPSYSSDIDTVGFTRSSNPMTWLPARKYLYEPQARDFGSIINNKIFFNTPDPTMPATAMVTDVFRNDTYMTWLFNPPASLSASIDSFNFSSSSPLNVCNGDTTQVGQGGYIRFVTNVSGTVKLSLDLDNNGSFTDPVDVTLYEAVAVGRDSILWNGQNGLGVNVVAQPNFTFSYRLDLRGGEIHIMLDDVENCPGQIVFTRLNGLNAPSDTVYYDFSNTGGVVSGGGTPGNPLPTTTSFQYNDDSGNRVMQDYWTYLSYPQIGTGTLTIAIVDSCGPVACTFNLPKPMVSANSPTCSNDNVQLSVLAPYPAVLQGTPATYIWTNANGVVLPFNTQNITFSVSAIYAVSPYTVKVTTAECQSPLSELIFVSVNQAPVAIATNSGPICSGGSVTLFAQTNPNATYTWTDAAGVVLSTQQNPTFNNIAVNTEYKLRVSVPGCASDGLDMTTVVVVPTPSITTIAGGDAYCIGSNVTLVGNGVAGATYNVTYLWSGPNGFSATGTAPASGPFPANLGVLDNTKVGSYTLILSNQSCSSAPQSVSVSVGGQLPAPTISAAATSVCVNETLQLTASPSFSGGVYTWTNGAGNVVTTTTNTLAVAGNLVVSPYTVSVAANGCNSPASAPLNVTVNQLPTAIATNGGTICTGGNANLFAQPSGGTYAWTVQGSSTVISTNQNPIILGVNATTTYVLSVTLNGCTSTNAATTTVNVTQKPTITGASGSTSVCAGTTSNACVVFDAIPTGTTFVWTGPNNITLSGIATGNSVCLNIVNAQTANTGTYTLVLTTSNGCVFAYSAAVNLTVLAKPTIANIVGAGDYCVGADVLLSATSSVPATGEIVKYTWTGPNGFTFTGNAAAPGPYSVTIPTASLTDKGSYTLVLMTPNGCMSDPLSVFVNVEPKPATPTIVTNSPVCAGDSIMLTTQNIVGASYMWFDGAGMMLTSTTNTVKVPSNRPQPFSVKISVNGCASDFSQPVNVVVNALPTVTASSNSPVCATQDSVQLFAQTSGGTGTVLYEWRIVGNTTIISTLQNPTVGAISANTTYEVTVKIQGCTQTVKATVTVVATPLPVVVSTSGGGQYCAGDSICLSGLGEPNATGNVTYAWLSLANPQVPLFAGQAPAKGPFPFCIFPSTTATSGTYVLVVIAGGCQSTPQFVQVNVIDKPIAPILSALDSMVCVGEMIQLVATPVAGGTYSWYFNNGTANVLLATTTTNTFKINDASPANSGLYTVTVTQNGCTSLPSSPLQIMVLGKGMAVGVTNNGPLCPTGNLVLTAPLIPGAIYTWYGPNGVVFNNAGYILTIPNVTTANAGQYYVVIKATECATDTSNLSLVVVGGTPIANPDNYTLETDKPDPFKATVLDNDNLVGTSPMIVIITPPKHGTATVVGNLINYDPNQHFVGTDELVYKICSSDCPNECDTALVTFRVQGPLECDIFDIITPNDDGTNDAFEILCVDRYPENELLIYNRWGDCVFQKKPYASDWKGTYKGTPLPASTYFYVFKPDPNKDTVRKGYLTIVR